jgi:hypothetical protein
MTDIAQSIDNQTTDRRTRPTLKHTYALDMWTVEKRPNGWYFSKSAYHGDKHNWRGPYASEMSVTLMIARELRREIVKRYQRQANEAPL